MFNAVIRWSVILPLLALLASPLLAEDQINESARKIPVAYDVDLVVVGGGTGAVATAVTAASQGARVFLAAPYPYLGDDMTATLRMWLAEGERPTAALAKKIFADKVEPLRHPDRLEFRYTADVPSSRIHRDTPPPRLLTDGKWADPTKHSVQYDQNVTIIADLKKVQPLRGVRIKTFYRAASFNVQRVTVSVSDDGKTYRKIRVIDNDVPEELTALEAKFGEKARYVKFLVEMPKDVERMLLGEIEIIGPPTGKTSPNLPQPPPRPMHVKVSLDDVLLAAGVKYLYSSYATDVLHDNQNQPCGIVMANRAGRQAVIAKTIVDTTPRAVVARMAGAKFRPFQAGTHNFKRVVIGTTQPEVPSEVTSRLAAAPYEAIHPNSANTSSGTFHVIEYTLPLHIDDDSYASYMRADQQARTITYHPEQQFTSDLLYEIPQDSMIGRRQTEGAWTGADKLPLDVLRPKNVERIVVLGGCADVSREQAEKLMRPLSLIDLGTRLGTALAEEVKQLPKPSGVRLRGTTTKTPTVNAEVREVLKGVRPTGTFPTIPQDARSIPVLGTYDVVVIGGGTGGAPAGIGAARKGAKTLMIEYLHGLGGVGTQGAITGYYWGNRVGFTATVGGGKKWVIEQKMEWYRKEYLKAGGELWFGTLGCGAVVKDNRVIGAVVATPYGRGVVLAKTVIDSTGNSDIVASTGIKCTYTDATEFGMQGTGLPGRKLGQSYNNTDFTLVDETDMLDVWRMFVFSKDKYRGAFDHGRLIDTRERRRIKGDFTVTLTDQINLRTYPDSIVRAFSNFDTHGYTIDPYLLLQHPEKVGVYVYVPFRAHLPTGLEGILITGLSVSAHRDALPLIRMQADIQNGGYAAGHAAAMAAEAGIDVRNIDVKQLQKHLIKIGNLPENVLTDTDSYPLSNKRVAQAVKELVDKGRGAAVVMTHRKQALPLIEEAYKKTTGADQLTYAKTLAVLGNAKGLDTLVAEVRQAKEWDDGWNYRGMGQFGAAVSPLDELIIAIGRTGDSRGVPVILEKVALLKARSDFSHHRAAALALETIGDKSAAAPLAELLQKEKMTGFVQGNIEATKKQGVDGGGTSERGRRESLRELLVARALYRCGDHEGLGEKILRNYTQDLRGHLARHAKAVLEAGK